MKRIALAALLALAALITLLALRRANLSPPCARLASAICDNGSADDCADFVAGQMVTRDGSISPEHQQIACQIVLDDPRTVGVMQAAFEGAQSTGGGSAKNGSASK